MSNFVRVPEGDWQNICNSVRTKTETTGLLKSGDVATAINGIETDPISAEALAKLELHERYFRAGAGESFKDWNPQPIDPNETATFEEAPEKYQITVETRGIQYKVRGDCRWVAIYPEFYLERNAWPGSQEVQYLIPHSAEHIPTATNQDINNAAVFDFSRLKTKGGQKSEHGIYIPGIGGESVGPSFVALPQKCYLGNLALIAIACDYVFSQGLSFGKSLTGMSASTIYYSQLNYGDKPVYVMEGFTGNLYLAKLNISAEHLIGIINNLGNTSYTGQFTLNIGSHNLEKLTDEQIAIATEKGWKVT